MSARIFYRTGFAYDVYLYLTRILNVFFDLLADITGKQHHIIVLDRFRLDDNAYLTACLNSKAAFNSVKR